MSEVELIMPCKNCVYCADGTNNWRKCYKIRKEGYWVGNLTRDEKRACKHYRYSEIPSYKKIKVYECPNCGDVAYTVITHSAFTMNMCEHCGWKE